MESYNAQGHIVTNSESCYEGQALHLWQTRADVYSAIASWRPAGCSRLVGKVLKWGNLRQPLKSQQVGALSKLLEKMM